MICWLGVLCVAPRIGTVVGATASATIYMDIYPKWWAEDTRFTKTLWFHSHWSKVENVRCTLRSRWENQGKKIHVYHILFIHSSGDGHGDCFRFLADVNSAIRRWLEMWVSQWYDVLESFGNTLVLFGHEECNRDFRGIDGARDHWVRRHKLHCERQVWYVWDLHACVYKT